MNVQKKMKITFLVQNNIINIEKNMDGNTDIITKEKLNVLLTDSIIDLDKALSTVKNCRNKTVDIINRLYDFANSEIDGLKKKITESEKEKELLKSTILELRNEISTLQKRNDSVNDRISNAYHDGVMEGFYRGQNLMIRKFTDLTKQLKPDNCVGSIDSNYKPEE